MTKRPIIVEGPDGAGKSTLVRSLAYILGRTVTHTGGAANTAAELEERLRQVEFQAKNPRGTIFDRVPHISDRIYKAALGLPQISLQPLLIFRLRGLNPIVVFCCLEDGQAMLRNISEAPKAHKPKDYLEKVKAAHPKVVRGYEDFFEDLEGDPFISVLRYDYSFAAPEEVADRILALEGDS